MPRVLVLLLALVLAAAAMLTVETLAARSVVVLALGDTLVLRPATSAAVPTTLLVTARLRL